MLNEVYEMLGNTVAESGMPLADEIGALLRAVAAARRGADTLALCAEHARLWGGISPTYGPPPPYESIVREGRLPGDATTAAAAAYVEAGLDPEVPEAGPADHLGVELRFVAQCCVQEALARRASDMNAVAAWVARQQAFLDDHLLVWAPAHCAAVAAAANDDYHRTIAQLIPLACELDRNDLEILAQFGPGSSRKEPGASSTTVH